ncbi:MAG: metal ABC transporter permease [Opitutaceae bacterium]
MALVLFALASGIARAQAASEAESPRTARSSRSITNSSFRWPTAAEIKRVVSLQDHNTRVVFLGTAALGAAGGLVGTFLLLRKRSLLSDTVSHATLPGLAFAFIVVEASGGQGKSLPLLLTGAVLSGLLGMGFVSAVRRWSRVKDDAALAIVLSVFFGLGICFTVTIQQMPTGNAAGIANFIYGKAASMTTGDARLILWSSLAVAAVCLLLYKELKLLCFDESFGAAQGWPIPLLDALLMALVVGVTVIGLQAVGLLLVVAMLIIPPAAARFWSERLFVNAVVATAIGVMSGLLGVTGSALFPKLPAGAVIVLAAFVIFTISLVFGAKRGLLGRWIEHRGIVVRVGHQHLMRAFYELAERHGRAGANVFLEEPVELDALISEQTWSRGEFTAHVRRAEGAGLVSEAEGGRWRLTAAGRAEARRVVRNHRLWELYLIQYADIAPTQVHRDADQIEHVVEPNIVAELEELLSQRFAPAVVPANPEFRSPAAS